MSLPSQDVIDDIRELITEITGFQEGDENFSICERYCFSHVVHHSYPSINRTTVKNLVNSYISRFYGHGYFKVSQELNLQFKSFLGNETLFQKNSQYDIQWCLLSLLSSLSSNLTSVKKVPDLLAIDEEESEVDDINWSEFLSKDLPQQYPNESSSNTEESESEDENDEKEEKCEGVYFKNSISTQKEAFKQVCELNNKTENILENNSYENDKARNEIASELRRRRVKELQDIRKSKLDIENDCRVRGNISEKFDLLMSKEGIDGKSQLLSEFEIMENILYQFQTGERLLLKKGLIKPALVSVTQGTLSNYLESLSPYFKIIRSFKDFDSEITEAKYPQMCVDDNFNQSKRDHSSTLVSSFPKKKISNVLYIYNVMLKKALEPFYNDVMSIVDNLEDYTLIKMQQKLRKHFSDLTSLFHTHILATKNWKKDSNWMSAIRILSVLYDATMNAISSKMSFVYLNLFLHCFQVYLDIIDNWISFVELIDPYDEFIVAKSESSRSSENRCNEYIVRFNGDEDSEIVKVPVLDYISDKMIQVGQSLEVLKRLGRFAINGTNVNKEKRKKSSYHLLVENIKEKIKIVGNVKPFRPSVKVREERKKSILTIANAGLLLDRDSGGGEGQDIGAILLEVLEEEQRKEKKKKRVKEVKEKIGENNYFRDFVYSTISNPYFKMAFDAIGVKGLEKKLMEAKERKKDGGEEALMVVEYQCDGNGAVYPFHKIILDSLILIVGNRVSDTCNLVKDVVLTECSFQTHLQLLRNVLLFNDAYLIRPFIHGFFTQPLIRGSSYSLTLHLKECVEVRYKEYASALTVVVADGSWMDSENILKAIDAININYEVKWPLTLIFTPEVMVKYNQIFSMILKLKWAHWALSSLQFQCSHEKESLLLKRTHHRLQVLRFWLLSAFVRINNYFMAQISIPLDVELESCKDIKDIIRVHWNFVEKIHRLCLLGKKCEEERILIFNTLIPLCRDVENCWQEGILTSNEKLSQMESSFRDSHSLLSLLMSSLEKK